jgi:RNA polymerase sigma-70 factor (ECF subfamily)
LYDAFAEPLWRAVARQVGPGSVDVADIVQETFLAAARSARTFDPTRGTLWLWLWGIGRRQVALHFRKQDRVHRLHAAHAWLAAGNGQLGRWLDGQADSPAAALETAELATLVRAALAELPADYESLLTAKYLDGASVAQLAQQQGCSGEAVRSKLARAREAFRRVFGKTQEGYGVFP